MNTAAIHNRTYIFVRHFDLHNATATTEQRISASRNMSLVNLKRYSNSAFRDLFHETIAESKSPKRAKLMSQKIFFFLLCTCAYVEWSGV